MDGRKHLLAPFQSLQNFRSIAALTATQELMTTYYAEAHPDLATLSCLVDIILINGECSSTEAIFACEEVLEAINAETNLAQDENLLLFAACNYTLAKLAVDAGNLNRAHHALATAFSCLQTYAATQERHPWQEPHFEYLQYCVHRLQGVIYLTSKEYIKSAQHFRHALGLCTPPYITTGAAILQSYLGLIHVMQGDVNAGFSILAQAEQLFDPALRPTSLDWMRHRHNLGCAFAAVQANEKALVEFEAVLAMQNVLFDHQSDYVCLEREAKKWMQETHTAIARIATAMGNHEKAALHLAEVNTDVGETDYSYDEQRDENSLSAEEMALSPPAPRFIVIPNPAFGIDANFFANVAENHPPAENLLTRRRGQSS